MRTPALAIAVSLCVGTSAAHAVCTTGVECIREQFGVDQTVRNNRIIDRTDALGDRGRPLNPYVAGQNVANQARRAGRFDATGGTGGTGGPGHAADPLRGADVPPDARYTPDGFVDPYAPGQPVPGEAPTEAEDLTVSPYAPAQPATGPAGSATARTAAGPDRGFRSAPAGRDPNAPQGSASRRYTGPQSSGAYR